MTDLDTRSTSPVVSPPRPHSLPNFALESTLLDAFPPLDAPDDALQQLADTPADSDLLAVAPRPILISIEELLLAIANAPRLIIRKVGVPLAALFAIAVALFLHLSILGIFILGAFFGFFQPKGHGNALAPGDEGGSGAGYMILGEGGPEGPPNLSNLLAHTVETPPAFVPPKLPTQVTPTPVAAQELASEPSDPEVIGIASAAPVTGTPKPRAHVSPPTPTPVVAPPSTNNSPILASAGATANSAPGGTGGKGPGGDPEGSPLVLVNGTGNGNGSGKGHKIGDGINRGESGANNPNPSVLDAPQIELADGFLLNPPKQSAVFEVTVLISGRAGTITLTQSCGNKDIDTLCAATIRRYKFRPAYEAGKAVERSMTITQDFTSAH